MIFLTDQGKTIITSAFQAKRELYSRFIKSFHMSILNFCRYIPMKYLRSWVLR